MSIHDNKIPIYSEFEDYQPEQLEFKQIGLKNPSDRSIYEFLSKNNSGKTREQICKELQLPRSSVYDALNRLYLSNFIEFDFKIKSKSKKGRPSTIYFLKNVTQGNKR